MIDDEEYKKWINTQKNFLPLPPILSTVTYSNDVHMGRQTRPNNEKYIIQISTKTVINARTFSSVLSFKKLTNRVNSKVGPIKHQFTNGP